ncbi:pectinesterase-like [Olea europaea subsp. europaea]|uniref:Pectinesterase-like n=1 Tax=Olea europaea subsp. europaea TaxID=158383 RepID=A0A8S0PMP4_OLEEU|nr:pectinesterase-like [Olea europaea subsp. europaea]
MRSVYALQSSCLNQIEKPENKSAIENGMIGEDGYPTWFRSADRKLLEAHMQLSPKIFMDNSRQLQPLLLHSPRTSKAGYIYVKAGIYNEFIIIDKKKPNVFW